MMHICNAEKVIYRYAIQQQLMISYLIYTKRFKHTTIQTQHFSIRWINVTIAQTQSISSLTLTTITLLFSPKW